MTHGSSPASSLASAWFQAPTCRSLGLELELALRNTARRLGSGEHVGAEAAMRVELRAYRRGELVYENPEAGSVAPSGSLLLRERDLLKDAGLSSDPEEEITFVAGLHRGSGAFFSQEHHLSYVHRASGVQAHLLYDQQPLKAAGAAAAPVVLMMPKIWIGQHVNTYLVASNAALSPSSKQHSAPVQFSVLDGEGRTVCDWQHSFFYNQAMAFDLRRRIAQHRAIVEAPQFFNLVGRGGTSTFVFFAVIRNTRSNHFAIEHSLPPLYYMDGAMAAVRAQGCDASLFRRVAP